MSHLQEFVAQLWQLLLSKYISFCKWILKKADPYLLQALQRYTNQCRSILRAPELILTKQRIRCGLSELLLLSRHQMHNLTTTNTVRLESGGVLVWLRRVFLSLSHVTPLNVDAFSCRRRPIIVHDTIPVSKSSWPHGSHSFFLDTNLWKFVRRIMFHVVTDAQLSLELSFAEDILPFFTHQKFFSMLTFTPSYRDLRLNEPPLSSKCKRPLSRRSSTF